MPRANGERTFISLNQPSYGKYPRPTDCAKTVVWVRPRVITVPMSPRKKKLTTGVLLGQWRGSSFAMPPNTIAESVTD